MFLIVRKPTSPAKKPAETLNASAGVTIGARTQNACDSCRLRKVKCNGNRPCGRCRSRKLVCIYSRTQTEFSGPVSAEHIALLQNREKRLTRAVRNMAATIRQLEGHALPVTAGQEQITTRLRIEAAKSASECNDGDSVDLAEMLERYAPEADATPDDSPTREQPFTQRKRARVEECKEGALASGSMFSHPSPPKSDSTNSTTLELQSEVSTHDPIDLDNSTASFMQFMLSMSQRNRANDMSAAPTINGNESEGYIRQHAGDFSSSLDNSLFHQSEVPRENVPWPMPAPTSDVQTQLAPLLDMVDWDASLNNFAGLYNDDQLGGMDPAYLLQEPSSTEQFGSW